MIKAVLFDMDGCLVDSEPIITRSAIEALAEWGVKAAHADFLPFVGRGEDIFIGGVAQKHGVPYDLKMKAKTYEIYFKLIESDGRPFPGVPELLAEIRKRGIKLAVASSADKTKVDANLKALGVPREWFEVVADGTMVAEKKPDPALFLETARLLRVTPAECCVVEDALHGVHAARAAGMRVVAAANTLPADQLHEADVVRPATGDITLADLGLA